MISAPRMSTPSSHNGRCFMAKPGPNTRQDWRRVHHQYHPRLQQRRPPQLQRTRTTSRKSFPRGVYAQLIKDYNNITLDGEKRTFPEKILLGADKVLARMYHEHHTSKHYTAVTLGEIMSQRVFTSLGTVNANRKKDDLDKRLIVDNKATTGHQRATGLGRSRFSTASRQ